MTLERAFRVNRVIPFLKTLKGTMFFPIQQISMCGDPDFILNCRGTFVALELKREAGKPRKLQQAKLEAVVRTHGVSIVASTTNWQHVQSVLQQLDEGGYLGKSFIQ